MNILFSKLNILTFALIFALSTSVTYGSRETLQDPDDDGFCANAATKIMGLKTVLEGITLEDAVAKYTHYEAHKDFVNGSHDISKSQILLGEASSCTLIKFQIRVPVLSDEVADLWHKIIKKSDQQFVIYYRSIKDTTHSSCTAGKIVFTQTSAGTEMVQDIRVGTSFSSKAREAALDTFVQIKRALQSGTSSEEIRKLKERLTDPSQCAQYGKAKPRTMFSLEYQE